MSWLFSQALVEEYSGGTSSDGELSAPLSGNPTQLAYLPPDRMTAFSRLSRFGMTFKPLTENLGRDVLTSYLEDFPVRTFLPLERAQASKEPDRECGVTWRELLARYDPDTSTWKTPQCSLLEDSIGFLGTWPRWGSMHDGASYQQQPLVRHTKGTGSGLLENLPTPQASDHITKKTSESWKAKGGVNFSLSNPEIQAKWPTPRSCSAMAATLTDQGDRFPNLETVMAHSDPTTVGGKLNPMWVEWLMGWPLGWTDLKPLAMDKYQQWRQQHGIY